MCVVRICFPFLSFQCFHFSACQNSASSRMANKSQRSTNSDERRVEAEGSHIVPHRNLYLMWRIRHTWLTIVEFICILPAVDRKTRILCYEIVRVIVRCALRSLALWFGRSVHNTHMLFAHFSFFSSFDYIIISIVCVTKHIPTYIWNNWFVDMWVSPGYRPSRHAAFQSIQKCSLRPKEWKLKF